MSLKSHKTILLTSCAIALLLIFSFITLFPRMMDNLITGMASLASFSVSVAVGGNNLAGNLVKQEETNNQHLTFFPSAHGSFEMNTQYMNLKYVNLTSSEANALNASILLRNPYFKPQTFSISFTNTNQFISNIPQNITVPGNSTESIILNINTQNLEPGEYEDFVYIRSSLDEEKITVHLQVMKKEEATTETPPEEEQPTQIVSPIAQEITNEPPKNTFSTIAASILIAVIAMIASLMIFKKKPKQDENKQEAKQDTGLPVKTNDEGLESPLISTNQQTSATNDFHGDFGNK